MAINENFVFSDAVPAQQAAAMAAITQQGEAERRRQMSETLRAVSAQNVARYNADQQRAMTQAQINQQNAALAQRDRESLRSDQTNRLAIQNDREDRNARQAYQDRKVTDANQRDQIGTRIATILADIEKSYDPPTPEDVEDAISLGEFSEAEKDHVRKAILRRRANINVMADAYESMAATLSNRLKSINPALTVERQKIIDEANKNSEGNIVFDSASGTFRSMFKRPRKSAMDADMSAPTPIGALLPQAAPAAPQPGIMSRLGSAFLPVWASGNPINQLLRRGINSTNAQPAIPATGTVPFVPPR